MPQVFGVVSRQLDATGAQCQIEVTLHLVNFL